MDKLVLIVDDHPLYRDALALLITSLLPEHDVLAAESVEEALRLSGADTAPQLIILDFGLRGISGSAAITEMNKRFPEALLLVISASEDRQQASAALRAGAVAFVSKGTPMEQMKQIILRILSGEVRHQQWDQAAAPLGLYGDALPDLPPRQREILALLMRGYSNKEIAIRLELAEITVKVHLTSVFKRLGVANRTQAVMALQTLGIAVTADDTVEAGHGSDAGAL